MLFRYFIFVVLGASVSFSAYSDCWGRCAGHTCCGDSNRNELTLESELLRLERENKESLRSHSVTPEEAELRKQVKQLVEKLRGCSNPQLDKLLLQVKALNKKMRIMEKRGNPQPLSKVILSRGEREQVVAGMRKDFDSLNQKCTRVMKRVKALERRQDQVNRKLSSWEERIKNLERQQKINTHDISQRVTKKGLAKQLVWLIEHFEDEVRREQMSKDTQGSSDERYSNGGEQGSDQGPWET